MRILRCHYLCLVPPHRCTVRGICVPHEESESLVFTRYATTRIRISASRLRRSSAHDLEDLLRYIDLHSVLSTWYHSSTAGLAEDLLMYLHESFSVLIELKDDNFSRIGAQDQKILQSLS